MWCGDVLVVHHNGTHNGTHNGVAFRPTYRVILWCHPVAGPER